MPFNPGRPSFADLNRRQTLQLLGGTAFAAGAGASGSMAFAASHGGEDEIIRAHGYSYFGDLIYPPDFSHFNYVNPDAPKGGEIVLSARGTFDGFNRWAWRGNPQTNSDVVGESLLAGATFGTPVPADSLTDQYCLIAREIEYPKSKEWCVFHLRDDVVFRNGAPLRAQDAAFTFNLFIEQGIRSFSRSVSERIEGVEVIDDYTLRYKFVDGISRRSLISQVGGMIVLSEEWYKETGERLDEPSVLSPMGSGPYQVGDYEFNRYVVYERNPNYWGWDHPVNVGRHNFDRIRIEYFADATAEFEAFKAGEYTFRSEGSSKRWATGYEFPALEDGHVVRKSVPDQTAPVNSGIIFNTLRSPVDNRNVRHALSLAFNFEWTRESLEFDLTTQRNSFAEGQEWEAEGVPEGAELAFLESLGDVVPPDMLTEPVVMPHTSNKDTPVDRRNKRKALRMLAEEGWTVDDRGRMVNEAGEQMSLDFLVLSTWDDTRKATIETYVNTLRDWGIEVNANAVDSAQGQQRFLDKDYDLIQTRIQTFATIGTGLKQLFGSETAEVSSWNPSALRSPVVDAIIEAALNAESREEEVTAMTALDRALRYERVIAHAGYVPEYWIAYYDLFEHPDELPPLGLGVLDFWWFNEEKYEALKAAGALR
ncbi:extracellular solute-binding protein [Marivita sp. XM-24bin2]|jgi:microcin C transport system substrate-binding protein|uniref:extracellular solute-binding protein n=1 Tax=unclassified Marivita TaxID=2632480 RepID=UPI000D7A28F9|nr:extracellular solute-binding protein [Marivita sp. XM-24bin2]MCR9107723.1 extracellular solute-binding protein [Paracoccaceae bacterium]PWL34797.1 MAG: ABC transporter substrate-binding protein [Marivita sp. XM-24bin2]